MVKSADTFIALNQVLDNQETDVIKATEKLTEIKVITGERAEVVNTVVLQERLDLLVARK